MTNAWTKGPWAIFKPMAGKYRGDFAIAPSAGPAFAYLAQGRDDIQEANARLIAAAPDMAEALEILLVKFTNCARAHGNAADSIDAATEQARAALARARGEAP